MVNLESQYSINRDVEENEQGSQLFKETYTNRLNCNGWLFKAYQDKF